ncbi:MULTISPECIES: alpha/beta fold hydrolase [unclassified Bradyrhizobium]|uniref:lipase family alpha/beta hydrolase n=1 Tax=unclassified Bradyrhizobium TaxID=2631580 RepID=UPI003398BC51
MSDGVDVYTIIFVALIVFIFRHRLRSILRQCVLAVFDFQSELRNILGRRSGSEPPRTAQTLDKNVTPVLDTAIEMQSEFNQDGGRPLMKAGDMVILIHGTFAKSATWIDEQSTITTRLKQSTPGLSVNPFRWSGHNSYAGRALAGKQLASTIKNANLPIGAKVHLVGHSHGGNVALYAIKDQEASSRVASLALLGTPFFTFRERNYHEGAEFFGAVASWQVYTLFAFYVLALIFAVDLSPLPPPGQNLTPFAVLATILLGVGMLFITIYSHRWRVPLKKKIASYLASRLSAAAQKMSYFAVPPPFKPVFVAWVAGDEARAWLGTLDAATAYPIALTKLVKRLTRSWLILVLIVMVISMLLTKAGLKTSGNWFDLVIDIAFWLAVIAAVVAPLLAASISISLRGHSLGYGWEGLFGHQAVNISVSNLPTWELPPGSHSLAVSESKIDGMRHSMFYTDAYVIEALVDWLTIATRARQESASFYV